MRYRTQAVAYPYFVVALLLYGLQMAFGLVAAVKYLGPDPISAWLPFDVSKAIHTNLLIFWVLTGFMGAAHWLVPEESRGELHSPRMAYAALALWTVAGVTAIVGYLFGWTAGNKFLEQPLPVKLAIVVVMCTGGPSRLPDGRPRGAALRDANLRTARLRLAPQTRPAAGSSRGRTAPPDTRLTRGMKASP